MQPPVPPRYRATLIERIGLGHRVSTGALMVIRNLERRPLRAAFTVIGVALAVALQISGAFWLDAIAHIVDVQYRQVQQGDVLVNFHRPVPLTVAQRSATPARRDRRRAVPDRAGAGALAKATAWTPR